MVYISCMEHTLAQSRLREMQYKPYYGLPLRVLNRNSLHGTFLCFCFLQMLLKYKNRTYFNLKYFAK